VANPNHALLCLRPSPLSPSKPPGIGHWLGKWVNDGREGVTLPAQEPHWAWQGQGKPVVVAESTTCPQEVYLLKENGLEVNSKEELLPKLEPLFTSAGSCQIALAAEAAPKEPTQFLTLNLRSLRFWKACESQKNHQKMNELESSLMESFHQLIDESTSCWDSAIGFVSEPKEVKHSSDSSVSTSSSAELQSIIDLVTLLPRVTHLDLGSVPQFTHGHQTLFSLAPDLVILNLAQATQNLNFEALAQMKKLKQIVLKIAEEAQPLNEWSSLNHIPEGVYLHFPAKRMAHFSDAQPWPSHVGIDWSEQIWVEINPKPSVPKGIRFLNLGNMEIVSLDILKDSKDLEELYLYNNHLSDIKILESMPQLKILDLGSNFYDQLGFNESYNLLKNKGICFLNWDGTCGWDLPSRSL